jgi:hypothetical protein
MTRKEAVWVGEPVIVDADLWHVSVEEAERLVDAIQDEGLEAWRYRWEKQEGFGPPTEQEFVLLWLASTAGAAVINEVVRLAVGWMRERFRREKNSKPKRLLVVLYEADEGQVSEVVEVESADAEPVRRLPQEEFEFYTRRKPPKY